MSRKILDSTLESASFNVIFQILLRCITFLLNAFVLRFVSQAVVGVMNVRLLLLESTILFLSREAFRRAALSQTESHSWPQIINLVWLTVPLSVVISFVFCFLWLNVLSVPSLDITPHYTIGVWSIGISCIIEMFAEPLYIVSQAFMFTKLKIVLYTLVVFVRTIIFVFWIVLNPQQAVVAFSAAQIIANSLYCVGFYIYFYFYIAENKKNVNEAVINILSKMSSNMKKMDDNSMGDGCKIEKEELERNESTTGKSNCGDFQAQGDSPHPRLKRRQSSMVGFEEQFPFHSLSEFLPQTLQDKTWIHPNSAKLTWSFFKQGVLKQILTEGERYIMTLFAVMTFKEQGMYDVVNNLGSLAPRFLFNPIEDSLYFYFTQSVKRDANIKDQNKERMTEASTVLFQGLKCIISIGLIIFVFGQSYSTLLLYLYGGETISSGQGPKLLQAHSFSVLLLGINGITECYAFSTMTAQQLNKYNYLMAVFSLSFLVISWGLTKLIGGIGFIFANCCIMSARIAHSLYFIKSRYENTQFQPLKGLIPNKVFLATLFVVLIITKITEASCHSLPHFLIGGVCFGVVTLTWAYLEQELVKIAIDKWKSRKSKKE